MELELFLEEGIALVDHICHLLQGTCMTMEVYMHSTATRNVDNVKHRLDHMQYIYIHYHSLLEKTYMSLLFWVNCDVEQIRFLKWVEKYAVMGFFTNHDILLNRGFGFEHTCRGTNIPPLVCSWGQRLCLWQWLVNGSVWIPHNPDCATLHLPTHPSVRVSQLTSETYRHTLQSCVGHYYNIYM